jgi:drug/metabolite transporter (DMT)-like permease
MTVSALEPTSEHTNTIPSATVKNVSTKYVWFGFGLVAASGVSFAVQGILGKWVYSEGANVPTVLSLRYVVAALVIAALVFGQKLIQPAKSESLKVDKRRLPALLILGLLWIPNSLFFFMALELIPASTAALIVFVFPALVVLWERLFFRVPLTRWKVAALVLAFLGCAFTIDPVAAFTITATFSWLGVLFALTSALSNSCYTIIAGFFTKGLSGMLVSFYIMPIGAVAFTLYSFASGNFVFNMSVGAWIACIVIGFLTAFSVVTSLIGLKIIGAAKASITASTEPASSIFLAAIFIAEPLTGTKLIGGALIICAILLLTRREK